MTMTMRLQYIDQLSGGRKRFRRRFPKAVQDIIGQEFFQVPMSAREGVALVNEREALVSQFNKIVKDAQRQAAGVDPVTPRQRWASVVDQAANMVKDVVISTSENEDEDDDLKRSVLADELERTKADPLLYRAVVSPSTPAPDPTLQDAKSIYRQERIKENSGRNQENRLDRVCRRLVAALGPLESIPLSSLRRVHGRKFRDHMLTKERKADGSPLSAASIQRELNMIRAMVSIALVEFDLKATVVNPFEKLELPKGAAGEPQGADYELRDPLPADIRKAMLKRLQGPRVRLEFALIWRLLEGTGCRGAEIIGLRCEDVVLDGQYPHIRICSHEGRSLKTNVSVRDVPLVGDALVAAKEALALHDGDKSKAAGMLFPRYAYDGGADAVSQALMKHLRTVTDNPRHAVYSLRHNFKDRLVNAGVPDRVQRRLMGHALGSLGDRVYGGGDARLREAHEAMSKIEW